MSRSGFLWIVSSTEPSPSEKKLLEFVNLKKGWHFGSGDKIDLSIIERGRDVVRQFLMLAVTQTNAFPGPNGEVEVVGYLREESISIIVEIDGTYSLVHQSQDREKFATEHVSPSKLRAHLLFCVSAIRDEANKKQLESGGFTKWGTSGYFILSSSIKSAEDLPAWQFASPTMADYQPSFENAQNERAGLSVPTSKSSTKVLAASRRYSAS